MYVQILLLSFSCLLVLIPQIDINNQWFFRENQKKFTALKIGEFGHAIQNFYTVNQTYPNSLNDLINSDGFYYLRNFIDPNILYNVVQVSDSKDDIIYERFILAINKNGTTIDDQKFLNDNKCGEQSFSANENFCGSNKTFWMIGDNRDIMKRLTLLEENRLDNTAALLYQANKFPSKTYSGKKINSNSTIKLSEIVGIKDDTCHDFYNFDGVIISCFDIYSVNGKDVYYQYISDYKAILFTLMSSKKTNGKYHMIVKELNK